jgi:hypothetical protein
MINPYLVARLQIGLIQAAQFIRTPAPWLKNAKMVLRDESGHFASEGGKANRKVTVVTKPKAFQFPGVEDFQNAELTALKTSAGSSQYATCEIKGQKYFLKRRTGVFQDGAVKEELSTKISQILGVSDRIIPAKQVKIGFKEYTVSPFVEGENLLEVDKPIRELLDDKSVIKLSLYEYAIANGDLNEGNFQITKKGLMIGDHEATFSSMGDFEGPLAEAFEEVASKVSKADLDAVIKKEPDILAAISDLVEDEGLAVACRRTISQRMNVLKKISTSEDIGESVRQIIA